jgi:hypothetical protein
MIYKHEVNGWTILKKKFNFTKKSECGIEVPKVVNSFREELREVILGFEEKDIFNVYEC